MSGRREKDNLSSWIYLGITIFAVIPVFGVLFSIGILLTVWQEYYQETNVKAGWIGSILFFLVGSSYPLVVFLRRHFGLRPVMLFAAVILVCAFVSTPFMPSLNFLFLTYSIPFGISAGFLDCMSIVTLQEYFDEFLGLATGLRFAALDVGGVAFGFLLPIFIASVGWKKTFFAFSSLGVAFVVYAMAYRKPVSRKEAFDVISAKDQEIVASREISEKTRARCTFLRNKGFLVVLAGSVLFFSICLVPTMFIIQHTKTLGYPLSKSKWTIMVYSLASVLGQAGIGRIADIAKRHGKVHFIPPAAIVLYGISCALCSLTQSLALIIFCMGLIGCLEGTYWAILQLLVMEVTSGKNSDEAFAFLICLSSFGFLFGPPAMGKLYDVTGDFREVLYLVSACAVTAGVIMTSGACVTSREDDASSKTEKQETPDSLKTNEPKYFNLLGRTSVPLLQGKQVIALVEYESAV